MTYNVFGGALNLAQSIVVSWFWLFNRKFASSYYKIFTEL